MLSQKRGHPDTKIFAWDTETVHGLIYYSAVFDGQTVRTCYGLRKDHFKFLLDCLPVSKSFTSVVFAYNLIYDLGCLTYPLLRRDFPDKVKRAPTNFDLSLRKYGCRLQMNLSKPCSAYVEWARSSGCRVLFRDAMAWFPERTSLDKAAEMVGSPIQKLEKPAKLGKVIYTEHFLRPYLERDVRVLFEVCKKLMAWHEQFDIPITLSMSHMSSVIYRSRFLDVPLKPSHRIMHQKIIQTYHGGKLFAQRGRYKKACMVDVKSAYPHAMEQLPKFCCGKWVYPKEFTSPWGVYRVAGDYRACKWGLFYPPKSNKPIPSGPIKDFWVTGLELQEALRTKHFKPEKIEGYVWQADPCKHRFSLREFVRYFYRLRQEAANKAEQTFPKLTMNGLYGKFFQRNEDEHGHKTIPGPMFEPMIASLITSHTRCYMHRLEHQFDSLHTATDSIITQKKIPKKYCGSGLGQLGVEVSGDVYIARNKCYAFFNDRGEIIKSAQHGFQGDLKRLIDFLQHNPGKTFRYVRKGLLTWKTAFRRGIQPGGGYSKRMSFLGGLSNGKETTDRKTPGG